MTDFKTLIDKATDKINVYRMIVGEKEQMIAFKEGAELPNELLLKAIEALETCKWDTGAARFYVEKTIAEIRQQLEEAAK